MVLDLDRVEPDLGVGVGPDGARRDGLGHDHGDPGAAGSRSRRRKRTGRVLGPGLAWTPAAGDDAVSACSHEFLHTSLLAANSQSYPATMSIEWEVAWTGSTGSGSLPGITTRRSLSFVVGEIQAVVSG
ncbi:MAG: hypothetical protein R2715_18730 [Ilumatobacteraceae bacterium]